MASLVAHYWLDDNACDTVVRATVGTNGVLVGGKTTQSVYEAGRGYGSFHFDGATDWVNIGLDAWSCTRGTMCLWAKNDSASPAGTQYILGRNHSGVNAGDCAIYLKDSTNKIGGFVEDALNTSLVEADSALSDTNWHHYLYEWEYNGHSYLYVDNVKQADDNVQISLAGTTYGFAIATLSADIPWGYWDGSIYDVRIYNGQLSEAERLAVFTATNDPSRAYMSCNKGYL